MDDFKLLVEGQGPESKYQARLPVNCVDRSSFYLQREKNGVYQIQFTAYDLTSTTGYDLLATEASVMFQDQEFIIKQIVNDKVNNTATKAVTATHISNECQHFRQHEVKTGVLTYKPDDVMKFMFYGNNYGFSYEIVGDFPSAQIENLGNMSGQDALNKIIEVWPDAVIDPDNRHIRIYQQLKFEKHLGHRLGYLYNSNEVKFTTDSTNVTNQVYCIGKAKDKEEGAPDDAPTEYFFPPFTVKNDDSISKYGVHELADISDDRFTNAESMKIYALKQLNGEPALTIEVTTNLQDQPILGDMTRLEVLEDNLSTNVEIVGYQWYPWDNGTSTQVTLNNTSKTIFDYQNRVQAKMRNDLMKKLGLQDNTLEELKEQGKLTDQQIKDLKDKMNNSNPAGWVAGNLFIDTSSNNGDISTTTFQDYANRGVRGIVCKLTEGLDYTNPLFNQHKQNAISGGLKFIGAYHFFKGDPVSEGNFFLKQLQDREVPKDSLVICDVESPGLSSNKATLTNQLKQFYKILTDAGYTNTCDYAAVSWFQDRFDKVAKFNWMAAPSATNPPNGTNAWQYTFDWNGTKTDASYSYNPVFV